MSSTTKNVRRGPDQERRAIGERTLERTETGRAAPNVGGAQPTSRIIEEHSSRRPILWSDSVHALVAARLARSHASKCARLAALCGWKGAAVVRDRTGSRRRRWWNRDHQDRGSSCRRARCLFDHRTWRAAEERSVRNHRLQPPTLRVGSGWSSVNTKCVRDCVRRFWSSGRCSSGNRHRTPTRQGTSNGCPLRGAHCAEVTRLVAWRCLVGLPYPPTWSSTRCPADGPELWVAGRSHGQRT
jgi:hypothetical protein